MGDDLAEIMQQWLGLCETARIRRRILGPWHIETPSDRAKTVQNYCRVRLTLSEA